MNPGQASCNNALPGNNINSGPSFVTRDALAKVEEFAGEYR